MEPAVIIMMLSVFFLLLSITVGLYSLFCGCRLPAMYVA